jgi:hypothetical protein
MRIVYLGYWGANEGLSQATINPHLEILAGMDGVNEIHYISIERNIGGSYLVPDNPKISHHPFHSRNLSFRLFTKILDIILLRNFLFKLISENEIDLIICRSSLAGVFGYFANKKFNIRYIVESFEPHADYMLELGIWSKWGLSYIMQTFWEKKQKRTAQWLIPVSYNYEKFLRSELSEYKNISTVPCGVDPDLFLFDANKRNRIRNEIGIEVNATVGIYVGKFGGIYFDNQAFQIFADTFSAIDNFYLLILSSTESKHILDQLRKYKLPKERVFFDLVPHTKVPDYLSAADFAYSLINPSEFRKYCCPIKNGEYWANGLPILIPEDIGDDSLLVVENQCGLVFSSKKSIGVNEFQSIIQMNNLNTRDSGRIKQMAINYRGFNHVKNVYSTIVSNICEQIET